MVLISLSQPRAHINNWFYDYRQCWSLNNVVNLGISGPMDFIIISFDKRMVRSSSFEDDLHSLRDHVT